MVNEGGADATADLTVLAQSIAGVSVGVAASAREPAHFDGESIVVPAGSDNLWKAVGAQALLVAAGSHLLAIGIPRRDVVLGRYVTLEVARAVRLVGAAVPRPLAASIAAHYDGPVTADAEASARCAAQRRSLVPPAPDWMGTVRFRRSGSTATATPTGQDAIAASQNPDDNGESRDRDLTQLQTMLSRTSNPLRRPRPDLVGAGRAEMRGPGAPSPIGGSRVGRQGRARAAVLTAVKMLRETVVGANPVGVQYPEWDDLRGRYRADWCSVAEWEPWLDSRIGPIDLAPDIALRRKVARLGVGHERHRRQNDGDSIDLTALVDYANDRAAGNAGDARVYEVHRRTAHDLGVLILLDATGSTGDTGAGTSVFEQQRLLAGRLTVAFEEVGDRVATYAFCSQGRQHVRFTRIKTFDGRCDAVARTRMAAVEPSGFTRLGAAVRHATRLLCEGAGTSKLMLLVVGDGLPYDHDGYERRYAEQDSHRALTEAVGRGVACGCISVGSSIDAEAVERVWGHVPHRYLEDPAELTPQVEELVRAALRQAGSVQKGQTVATERRAA